MPEPLAPPHTNIAPAQVAVYNLCTDTTRHMNGVVTNMHPSEGVWLFRCAGFSVCIHCYHARLFRCAGFF